jgi:signal transduction histidine kinase
MFSLPWDEAFIIIFFFYGLAFFSMGLALFVESDRASELGFARSMRLLSAFGVLHGINEWLDMTAQGVAFYHHQPLYDWLQWLKLAILVTSFLALLLFSEQMLTHARPGRRPIWRITAAIFIWYTVSCIVVRASYQIDDATWLNVADVLARYILGVSSGLLACWTLWQERQIFRERGMEKYVRDLTIAAIALALYGVIGQFITRPSVIFPSTIINSDVFLKVAGFPIQLFRAIMAAVVAISMIRVLRSLEVENTHRLDALEHARLESEIMSREELARLNSELQIANKETERLLQEVQQRDAIRGELLQRITNAQESERKRIARELHDGTGQALTGLALGLRGLAARVSKDPDSIGERLGVLEAMATGSLGELRHLINDVRPPQLDDMGLVAALRWLTERFKDRDNPSLKLEILGDVYPLPSEVETTLFRIAQEGLTNAIKHAHANHIWITLNYDDGPSLSIRDNGVGFDMKAAMNPSMIRSAWGIAGMQERSNLINATFTVNSMLGAGTTFMVRLNEAGPQEILNAYKNIDC